MYDYNNDVWIKKGCLDEDTSSVNLPPLFDETTVHQTSNEVVAVDTSASFSETRSQAEVHGLFKAELENIFKYAIIDEGLAAETLTKLQTLAIETMGKAKALTNVDSTPVGHLVSFPEIDNSKRSSRYKSYNEK